MTVHRSKGLEFPVVYVPNLVKGQFPSGSKGKMVNPPADWTNVENAASANSSEDEKDEETDKAEAERLFFVALSRARDALVLSYPLKWNSKSAVPSELLMQSEAALNACGAQHIVWSRTTEPESNEDIVTFAAATAVEAETNTESGTAHDVGKRGGAIPILPAPLLL